MNKKLILIMTLVMLICFCSTAFASFSKVDSDTDPLLVKKAVSGVWVTYYVDWDAYERVYYNTDTTNQRYIIEKLWGVGAVTNSVQLAGALSWIVTDFNYFKEYKDDSLYTTKSATALYNQGMETFYTYTATNDTDHYLSYSNDWEIKNAHKITFMTTTLPQWWTTPLSVTF